MQPDAKENVPSRDWSCIGSVPFLNSNMEHDVFHSRSEQKACSLHSGSWSLSASVSFSFYQEFNLSFFLISLV